MSPLATPTTIVPLVDLATGALAALRSRIADIGFGADGVIGVQREAETLSAILARLDRALALAAPAARTADAPRSTDRDVDLEAVTEMLALMRRATANGLCDDCGGVL